MNPESSTPDLDYDAAEGNLPPATVAVAGPQQDRLRILEEARLDYLGDYIASYSGHFSWSELASANGGNNNDL